MNNLNQVFINPADKTGATWCVMLNGRVLPTEWNSKGAAEAGLEVERRRAAEYSAPDAATGLMRAQVVYRQGLVKDFICADELTLHEFMRRVSAFGKVRVLRSMRVVKDLSVELVPANNVTVLR